MTQPSASEDRFRAYMEHLTPASDAAEAGTSGKNGEGVAASQAPAAGKPGSLQPQALSLGLESLDWGELMKQSSGLELPDDLAAALAGRSASQQAGDGVQPGSGSQLLPDASPLAKWTSDGSMMEELLRAFNPGPGYGSGGNAQPLYRDPSWQPGTLSKEPSLPPLNTASLLKDLSLPQNVLEEDVEALITTKLTPDPDGGDLLADVPTSAPEAPATQQQQPSSQPLSAQGFGSPAMPLAAQQPPYTHAASPAFSHPASGGHPAGGPDSLRSLSGGYASGQEQLSSAHSPGLVYQQQQQNGVAGLPPVLPTRVLQVPGQAPQQQQRGQQQQQQSAMAERLSSLELQQMQQQMASHQLLTAQLDNAYAYDHAQHQAAAQSRVEVGPSAGRARVVTGGHGTPILEPEMPGPSHGYSPDLYGGGHMGGGGQADLMPRSQSGHRVYSTTAGSLQAQQLMAAHQSAIARQAMQQSSFMEQQQRAAALGQQHMRGPAGPSGYGNGLLDQLSSAGSQGYVRDDSAIPSAQQLEARSGSGQYGSSLMQRSLDDSIIYGRPQGMGAYPGAYPTGIDPGYAPMYDPRALAHMQSRYGVPPGSPGAALQHVDSRGRTISSGSEAPHPPGLPPSYSTDISHSSGAPHPDMPHAYQAMLGEEVQNGVMGQDLGRGRMYQRHGIGTGNGFVPGAPMPLPTSSQTDSPTGSGDSALDTSTSQQLGQGGRHTSPAMSGGSGYGASIMAMGPQGSGYGPGDASSALPPGAPGYSLAAKVVEFARNQQGLAPLDEYDDPNDLFIPPQEQGRVYHPVNKFKRERSLRTQAMPPPVPQKKAATASGGGLAMPEIPLPSHSGGSDDGDSSEQGTNASQPVPHLSPRWGQPKPGDPLGLLPPLPPIEDEYVFTPEFEAALAATKDPKERKRMLRKEKNRQSAAFSRTRREAYTTTLENEVRRLQKEKEWYQQQLSHRTGGHVPRPNRFPSDPTKG